jgi:hypothetical protein
MAYRIGIDVGATETVWASVQRDGSHPDRVDGGSVPSIVALVDGQLVAGGEVDAADPARRQHVTGGFVGRLGDADAVMLGGTPYGVETLIGRLLASVIHSASDRLGGAPGAVAIVHDDGLDDYHTGLLTEAARLAGIPLADVVLVSRSDAVAAAGSAGLAGVAGAAIASWARHPDPVIAPAATGIGAAHVGLAAGAAATTAGGAALAASGLGDAAASTAFAAAPSAAAPAATGPTGSPLGAGPTGTPVGAGPSGSPIGAGPTGTPVGAGPAGTPLSPPAAAGPAGTPLSPAAGPAGTPLTPPVAAGPSIVPAVVKRGWKWPVAIGAGVAVVAVAAVVIVSAGGDDTPAAAPTSTAAITIVPGSGSATDTVVPGETTAVAVAAVADPACVPGEWTMDNDSFSAVYSGLLGSAGASGQIVLTDVSGTVKVTIAADGTWTLTYDNWSLHASIPEAGGEMQIGINGVDVSTGTFKDDGTFAFSGISIGTTLTAAATVNGVVVPIPPIDRTSQVAEGTGNYTCSGNTMEITVPTAGTYVMNRTG